MISSFLTLTLGVCLFLTGWGMGWLWRDGDGGRRLKFRTVEGNSLAFAILTGTFVMLVVVIGLREFVL